MRKIALAAAGAALTAAAAVTAPTAHAAPAPKPAPKIGAKPITVLQIPAIGVQVSGLVIPGPIFVGVQARTGAKPGDVVFSSPMSPESCQTTAGHSVVDIGYTNLQTGRSGSTRVKPCDWLSPVPRTSTVHTGKGTVAVTVSINGSKAYPNAGQPALPGVGFFTAP